MTTILLKARDVSSYVPWAPPERMAALLDPTRPIHVEGALPIMGGLFYRLVNVGPALIQGLDRLGVWWGYDLPFVPVIPADGADLGQLDQVALEQRMRRPS